MSSPQPSAVLTVSDDLPVRTARPVHSGKVRSVYFLGAADSRRLIESRGYDVHQDSLLALMVISDRLSAFDCAWKSESLDGVPGKGAALNAISAHWFKLFSQQNDITHHLLEMPHPMLWIVRQAQPVKIEAIARRYLTGSLWRAYEKGERQVAGAELSEGMLRYQRLPELLFTPSTKGVIRGLSGVDESDDAPVAPEIVANHARHFGLRDEADLLTCEQYLRTGFSLIETTLANAGRLLVDTKFEFGFAPNKSGDEELLIMDEVGTPDSSRIWRTQDWEAGKPVEYSKEQFRESLMSWVEDVQLLLDPARMAERSQFAKAARVPDEFFNAVAHTYLTEAESIVGGRIAMPERPREEMLGLLAEEYGLLS